MSCHLTSALTLASALSCAVKSGWALNYMLRKKFSLPNLQDHTSAGTRKTVSIADHFNIMPDKVMDWATAAQIRSDWIGKFLLKGIINASDAHRAVDIGAHVIVVTNYRGRQLAASR